MWLVCVCMCVYVYVCVGEAERLEAPSICSSVLGSSFAFAMCGLSSAVCLTPSVKQHRTDAAYRHVGSSRRGIAHNTQHTERKRGEAESSLGWAIRGKSWACREDSYQLIVLPHLSVAPSAAY